MEQSTQDKHNTFPGDNQEQTDLLKSRGLSYTQKSKKLEDAKSSAGLFIVFGVVGILLILALWAGIIPLNLALYMKILYTVVLGTFFVVFLVMGFHYRSKVKDLALETTQEEAQIEEILSWVALEYPMDKLDALIGADTLPMEQLYFARYEKLSALIREKYQIQEEAYLDYLIEKILES